MEKCKKGHKDSFKVFPSGKRECKVCGLERWRRYRARKLKAGTWTHGKTEREKAWRRKYMAEYRKRPEVWPKVSARLELWKEVHRGKLKPLPCKKCGAKKTEGHHPDYFKPLEVVWLCRSHHIEKHKK